MFSDNINHFDNDTLECIIQGATVRFDDLTKASDTIDIKANTLFGILMLIIVSSLGFFVSKIPTIDFTDLLIQDAILICTTSSISLIRIYQTLFPTELRLKGEKPKFHVENPNFRKVWSNDFKKKTILRDRLHSLETAIEINSRVHNERAKSFKTACGIIGYSMPIIVAYSFVYIVISMFQS